MTDCESMAYAMSSVEVSEWIQKGVWIRFDAVKPPFGKNVLVFNSNQKKVKIAALIWNKNDKHRWSSAYGRFITHWMPLPKPPLNQLGELPSEGMKGELKKQSSFMSENI